MVLEVEGVVVQGRAEFPEKKPRIGKLENFFQNHIPETKQKLDLIVAE